MTRDKFFKIGYIMRPHGLKGQVTIALDPEAPADFSEVESIFVEINERLLPFFVEEISPKGSRAFLKLQEVDSPEEAEEISKSAIYLPKAARPKSARGEFYDDEITGFQVSDTDAGVLGDVTEVIQAGPNKLLSVNHQGKEVLIPVNGPFINSINKSRRTITVTLPEGFLEI